MKGGNTKLPLGQDICTALSFSFSNKSYINTCIVYLKMCLLASLYPIFGKAILVYASLFSLWLQTEWNAVIVKHFIRKFWNVYFEQALVSCCDVSIQAPKSVCEVFRKKNMITCYQDNMITLSWYQDNMITL
jgi:hypothetical protein